jgi:hypothetical protein
MTIRPDLLTGGEATTSDDLTLLAASCGIGGHRRLAPITGMIVP